MFVSSNKKRKSTDLEGTPTPKLDQKQNGAKTPKSGLKFQTPKSGLKMQTPKSGLKMQTPKSALKMQSPKSGLKMQTPKQNVKPGTPKSNEKKGPSKNGARKSLAINGSPKVEKTTSTEKTVPVKVEAGGKPPGNKKRNRKRSLSQPGVQSPAKTPKLEKIAGTASLDSDKKENADKKNRSTRRRQANKVKRDAISKSNKKNLKAKVLEGDIEAHRDLQAKLDVLIAIPVKERNNSQRRRIRQIQSWLKIKPNPAVGQGKQVTVAGKVQKAAQKKKQGPKAQTHQVIKTEALQKEKEEPQSDDDSDKSNEESSDEGDFEMLSAESRAEEGSDEEDSDMGEEDSDIEEDDSDIDEDDSEGDEEDNSKVVVNQKTQKQNQVNKKPVNSKPQQQNKGKGNKGFGKPGNKKFAGHQKKSPLKK